MIFVQEPYFNEPGYESSRGKPKGKAASKAYNDSLLRYTIRHAMRDQISSPSACFKKVGTVIYSASESKYNREIRNQ